MVKLLNGLLNNDHGSKCDFSIAICGDVIWLHVHVGNEVKKAHAQVEIVIHLVCGWEEKVLEMIEDCQLSPEQG